MEIFSFSPIHLMQLSSNISNLTFFAYLRSKICKKSCAVGLNGKASVVEGQQGWLL